MVLPLPFLVCNLNRAFRGEFGVSLRVFRWAAMSAVWLLAGSPAFAQQPAAPAEPVGTWTGSAGAGLSLTVGGADEAERIYTLLSNGGQVFMAMAETFFAVRFGMLRDRFGTSWMILALKPQTP